MCGLYYVFTDIYLDIYIYIYIVRITICSLWISFLWYCSVYLTFNVIAFYWSLHLKLLVNINKDIIVVYYLAHHHVYRLLLHIIDKQQSNDIKQKPMRMHVVQLEWYYCRMQFLNDYKISLPQYCKTFAFYDRLNRSRKMIWLRNSWFVYNEISMKMRLMHLVKCIVNNVNCTSSNF